MSKHWIVFLSILPILTLVSCSSSPEQQSTNPPPPPVTASPPPVAPPPAQQPLTGTPGATQSKASSKSLASMGLIPATDPKKRVQEVQKARNNPFGLIPIIPVVETNNLGDKQVNSGGKNARGQTGQNVGSNAGPQTGNQQNKANDSPTTIKHVVPVSNRVGSGGLCRGQAKDAGSVTVKEAKLNLLPEKAYQVEVSGIIDLPNAEPVAIIKDASQPVAQYVTPGSRLSNGLVLVKSIDTYSQQVALQQQGFDQAVYRAVGQPVEKVSSTFTPSQIEVQPPGPDGFGIVRNLMLDKVSLGVINIDEAGQKGTQTRLYGTLCNDGKKTIEMNNVKIQIQDANNNNILDSRWNRINESSSEIAPGQKIEFDFSVPKLRNRERGKVYVKFLDWR